MISENVPQLGFAEYSSQAKNNFKKNDIEIKKAVFVKNEISNFYKSTKNAQGIIGKTWDKIKCYLNFKTSSKNTEEVLKKYENNYTDNSCEADAIIAMNKYAKSQQMALNASRNFVASAAAGGLFSLMSKKGIKNDKTFYAMFVLSAATGAICAVVTKALDAKSAKQKYDKQELKKDIGMGVIQGALSAGLSYSIIEFVGNTINPILKSLIKSGIKFITNVSSSFGFAKFETNSYMRILKRFQPKKFDTVMQKIKKQHSVDEYVFYNPRYDINNNSDNS